MLLYIVTLIASSKQHFPQNWQGAYKERNYEVARERGMGFK